MNKNVDPFMALVRAGLWEKEVRLSPFGEIDFDKVYRLAEEQSVVGLVAAGIEHVVDVKIPQQVALSFAGMTLQLEPQNLAMNNYIETLIGDLRKVDVYALLMKGQGIAQCYERPLWRYCGDIDLLLSDSNYQRAKNYLLPLSSSSEPEYLSSIHLGMTINEMCVELHGSLRCGLWRKVERGLNGIQRDIFFGGCVRSWMNERTQVFLPRADEDAVYVFAHILQHFFKGGIGLRQVCDWCRLLWTYRNSLNTGLLELRIRQMGLMTEWKTFASVAVDLLGMQAETMPLYDAAEKWKKKAQRVFAFMIETGNMGHNRDDSFRYSGSVLKRKFKMFLRITSDTAKQFKIFPLDSIKVWWLIMVGGINVLLRNN